MILLEAKRRCLRLSPKHSSALKVFILAVVCVSQVLTFRQFSAVLRLKPLQDVYRSKGQESAMRRKWLLESKPRPLVVVAAGIPRTGSTWVFNVLRILTRKRDPNAVSGYVNDLVTALKHHSSHRFDNMNMSWLEAYKSLNTSLLVKVHGPQPWNGFSGGKTLEASADLTVLTHRDLRTEVRSLAYKKWISRIGPRKKTKSPFENPATWVEHAKRMLDLRNTTLASVGSGRFVDIRYEDWSGQREKKQLEVIRQLADELSWKFTKNDLISALVETKRIAAPPKGTVLLYNPVNQLHGDHRRVEVKNPRYSQAIQAGVEAIEKDPICKNFLKIYRYL